MLRRFFNGEFSLTATYWGGVFAVGLGVRLLTIYLNGVLVRVPIEQFDTLFLVVKLLAVALAVWLWLMVRALWRAGHRDRTPGIWGWIGIGLTTVGAAWSTYAAVSLWVPSIAQPRWVVEQDIEAFNLSLPQEVAPGLTMLRAEIVGDDLIYRLSAGFSTAEIDRAFVEGALALDDPEAQAICRDIEGYFRGGIAAIVYDYRYTDDRIEARMEAGDCLSFLDANR